MVSRNPHGSMVNGIIFVTLIIARLKRIQSSQYNTPFRRRVKKLQGCAIRDLHCDLWQVVNKWKGWANFGKLQKKQSEIL